VFNKITRYGPLKYLQMYFKWIDNNWNDSFIINFRFIPVCKWV